MNSTLPNRGSNIPYTFDPGNNASVDVGIVSPTNTTAQDRLVVGVDFGTTYSGWC